MIDKLFARAAGIVFLVVLLVPKAAAGAEPPVPGAAAAPRDRPCVLMVNQNVLFGTAQQRGEYVIVRRDDESEIQLKRKDVACWAKSIRGLYQFRIDHQYKAGVATHLENARWCLRYDLLDLATQELQSAYAIAPGHPEVDRLEQQLSRAAEIMVAGPVVTDPTKPLFDQSAIQLASHAEETEAEETCDASTLHLFARHITRC